MLEIQKVDPYDDDNKCYNVFIIKWTSFAVKWFDHNPAYSHSLWSDRVNEFKLTLTEENKDSFRSMPMPPVMFFKEWENIKHPHFSVFDAEDELQAYTKVYKALEEYEDIKLGHIVDIKA